MVCRVRLAFRSPQVAAELIPAGKPGGLCGIRRAGWRPGGCSGAADPAGAAGIGRTTGSLRDTVDLLPVVDDVHRLAGEQGAGRGVWRYVHGRRPALPGDLGSEPGQFPGEPGAKLRAAPGPAPRQGMQRPPASPPPCRGSRPCGAAGSAGRRRRQAPAGWPGLNALDDDTGAGRLLVAGHRGNRGGDLGRVRGRAGQRLRQAQALPGPLKQGDQRPARRQADSCTGQEGRCRNRY